MSRSKTTAALILVDVQYDFLPGGSLAVANGDEILPVILDTLLQPDFDWMVVVASQVSIYPGIDLGSARQTDFDRIIIRPTTSPSPRHKTARCSPKGLCKMPEGKTTSRPFGQITVFKVLAGVRSTKTLNGGYATIQKTRSSLCERSANPALRADVAAAGQTYPISTH